jgi:hypothetical protein
MAANSETLIAHTRSVTGLLSCILSQQVRAALRCQSTQPAVRDALYEVAQSLAHYSLQLRIVAGTHALAYHVVPFHTTLVMLVRLVGGVVCSGLELLATAVRAPRLPGDALDDDESQSLPYIVQYCVQLAGAELGRERRVADQLVIVAENSIDVDDLVNDVALNAARVEQQQAAREAERARRAAVAARRKSQQLLLAQLDFQAESVDEQLVPPPKPIGFDEGTHWDEAIHGDYKDWAKQKYAYEEYLSKLAARQKTKKALQEKRKSITLQRVVIVIVSYLYIVYVANTTAI